MQSALINQQQQDKIDQLKKDFQRKGEDAQTAYQKRLQEVLGPFMKRLQGPRCVRQSPRITLILTWTRSGHRQRGRSLDITKAFITEFNSKNPATAAVTPPK